MEGLVDPTLDNQTWPTKEIDEAGYLLKTDHILFYLFINSLAYFAGKN